MIQRILFVLIVIVLGCTAVSAAEPLPAQLPPHPRLLFTAKDLPTIKARVDSQPWAKSHFNRLKSQADTWLKTEVKLPERGGQWYHWYSCPKHGARLRTESPTRHVCPVDKEVFTGYPYDDVALMGVHGRLADAVRELGIMFQLTQNQAYAAKAREILLAYAAKYESYPLHTIKGEAKVGGGKVGPQTLDEAVWLIDVVQGADCIWNTLSEADRKQIAAGLLYPATTVIRQHKMSIHNIQCWKNSAVGLTGLLLGDMALVEEAINSPSGYRQQMAKGVSADGPWYENAWGYHFYTVSAVTHLTEGAFHSGINMYGPEFKRMFDAPIRLCMPDFRLPAFNDSGTASVTGSASLYETAYARYKEPAYREVLARYNRASDSALLHGGTDIAKAGEFSPASGNFTATGNAVLSAGKGANALWLCLDYGPHGGGHGHPDKLGFVMFGQGQILAPDPGTANYGVPIQAGWFRTTIAHNTLTVDETSQQAAEGKCEAFIAADGLSTVTATAGKIYDDVVFRRTVAMIGDRLLVFIDQAKSGKEHTYDFAYHNIGKITAPAGAQPFTSPQKPGYSYLRDTKAMPATTGMALAFDTGKGKPVHWSAAGGKPTTYITGTGVGAHTEDRVPLVISRFTGKDAVLRWAVATDAPVTVTVEPVKAEGAVFFSETEVAAVRAATGDTQYILLVNPSGLSVQVADQSVKSKLAVLRAGKDGRFQVMQQAQ